MTKFSQYLSLLGFLTAIPAVLTGIPELLAMIKKQDLVNKMQKSENKIATVQEMHPKMKIAFAHAALNEIAVIGTGYNLWTRKSTAGYAPTNTNIYVSAALLFGLLSSAYLGGKLVYENGVGVAGPSEQRLKKQ
jgi:uncharacterized membrane protein